MVTKRRFGSERVQPDSRGYLAIERACQDAFSSHPKGMALPALRFVERKQAYYLKWLADDRRPGDFDIGERPAPRRPTRATAL